MEPQDTTQSARWTRAITHVRQGDWEKALPELEILLGEDPDNSDYLNLEAHSLLKLGEYERAIACFERWVSKHPTAETWIYYGYALATVGRLQALQRTARQFRASRIWERLTGACRTSRSFDSHPSKSSP